MKALTIWQPWATLIMIEAKPYEFRTYPSPRFVWNERVVIHAGKKKVDLHEVGFLIAQLEGRVADGTALRKEPALKLLRDVASRRVKLPLAAAIGTVMMGQPKLASDLFADQRADPKIWGWPVSAPEAFEPIIPMRGFQGFWDFPTGLAA